MRAFILKLFIISRIDEFKIKDKMEQKNEIATTIDNELLLTNVISLYEVINENTKEKSKKQNLIENILTKFYNDFKLSKTKVNNFRSINFPFKYFSIIIEVLLIQMKNYISNESRFNMYFQILLFFELNIIEFDSSFKPYYNELISIIESIPDNPKACQKTEKLQLFESILKDFKSFQEVVDINHILYIDNYVFHELYFKDSLKPIEKKLWFSYLLNLDVIIYLRLNKTAQTESEEEEQIKPKIDFSDFLKVDIIIDNFIAQVIDFFILITQQPEYRRNVQDLEIRISRYFSYYEQNISDINNNMVKKVNKQKLLFIELLIISFFGLDTMNYTLNMNNAIKLLLLYFSKDKTYYSYFMDIFYILKQKLDNPLYIPFQLNGVFRKNMCEIISKNSEKIDDYLSEDYQIKSLLLIEFNSDIKINIYNGAFLFLQHLIAQSNSIKDNELIQLINYSSLNILQIIKGIIIHPNFIEYQQQLRCNLEIIHCIYQIIKCNYQQFTINEWKSALSVIIKIHSGDNELKREMFFNQYIFNTIKIFHIKINPTFFENKDFNEIIMNFLTIEDQPLDERNLDLIKFKLLVLEFCPQYKFKSVLEKCLLPIVNTQFQITQEKRLSLEDYFLSLILLFDLLSKLLADPEKEQGKKEIVEKEVISIFTNFIHTFTKAYDEIIREGEKNENKKDDSQGGLL